jgi:hypothetical protein
MPLPELRKLGLSGFQFPNKWAQSGLAAFGDQSGEFAKSFKTVPAPKGSFRRGRKSLNLLPCFFRFLRVFG